MLFNFVSVLFLQILTTFPSFFFRIEVKIIYYFPFFSFLVKFLDIFMAVKGIWKALSHQC